LRPLHDRALTALQRCEESQSVDFKRSCEWTALKWRLIETILAMGNLRDGGVILIGVAEGEKSWEIGGMSDEHLDTYDVDVVNDQVNAYVSPHANITLAILLAQSKKFLAIEVREFTNSPLVCKKNGPTETRLAAGAVYVRPPGRACNTRVTTAEQMHDLLELAAEKRARRIIEVGTRVGLVPSQSDAQRFDDELEGL
jgi:predicted HTH transcriptional regulator